MRWGDYPELSGWAPCNHKEGKRVTGKKDMTTEAEDVVMCFEDDRDPRAKEPRRTPEGGKGKEIDSPLEPPEGTSSVDNLTLDQGD